MKLLPFFQLLIVFLLLNCTAPVLYNPGLAALRGAKKTENFPVDSLVAKAKITVYEGKKKTSAGLIVSLVPKKAYKMDIKGPLGNQLAEFLWIRDSNWVLNAPEQNLYESGEGELVHLPNFNLENVSIHLLLGFLWGEILGDSLGCKSHDRQKTICRDKMGKQYFIHKKSGHLLELAHKQNKIKYGDYREHQSYVFPHEIRFFQNGKQLLSMEIKKVKWNPAWKKSPFSLSLN